MESRLLRPVAIAMLAVVAVYFILVAADAWTHDWRAYVLVDLAFYFCVGFFAARALSEWRGAVIVVVAATALDCVLGVAALILPAAHALTPAPLAISIARALAINIGAGAIGAFVGIRTKRQRGLI